MQEHRTAEVTLTLRGSDGKPLANRPITVRQTAHAFLFGCNVFKLNSTGSPQRDRAYADRFAALMNYATLPFYWGGYEPEKDCPLPEPRRRMAEWCLSRAITPKGHPLCWHEVLPKWAPQRGGKELLDLQTRRIRRDVRAFRGMVKWWDVVNEVCVMPRYQTDKNPMARLCRRMGRTALVSRMFAEARKSDHSARFILNDYDVSDLYEKIIEDCLEAGVKIDAIGIQSHMHTGWWGEEKIVSVCDRFSRFGIPLHFTELTILSGALKTDSDWHSFHPGWESTPEGEKRQAMEVEKTYRALFGHKAVRAVTWWDFSDLGAWQGAPAGLLRKDMTPKPAYEVLMDLVQKEWRTGPLRLVTDALGRARFRGYLGSYALEIRNKRAADFHLHRAGCLNVGLELERGF